MIVFYADGNTSSLKNEVRNALSKAILKGKNINSLQIRKGSYVIGAQRIPFTVQIDNGFNSLYEGITDVIAVVCSSECEQELTANIIQKFIQKEYLTLKNISIYPLKRKGGIPF
jgi:hypothetical protein